MVLIFSALVHFCSYFSYFIFDPKVFDYSQGACVYMAFKFEEALLKTSSHHLIDSYSDESSKY